MTLLIICACSICACLVAVTAVFVIDFVRDLKR